MAKRTRRLKFLYEFLEWQVLMSVGAEANFFYLPQKFSEGLLLRKTGTQGQHVDEEADQRLHLAAMAACDCRPDHDIPLTCVAPQQSLESGQQQYEAGHTFSLTHLFQLRAELFRKHEDGNLPGEHLLCRSAARDREFEHRRSVG